MRRLRSLVSSVLPVAGLVALSPLSLGCRKATEIVVSTSVSGPLPAHYTIKVSRSIPFSDIPTMTPPFVVPSLGASGDLDLDVTAATRTTQVSLLPSEMMPIVIGSRDLVITIDAPGYTVDPANPQPIKFTDGASKEIKYLVTALPPDMGAGMGKDAGAGDAGTRDAAMPVVDLASHD